MSTHVGDDARSAYGRFRRQAFTLGGISSSFNALTLSLTAAFLTALTRPAAEAWVTVVTHSASLVDRTHTLPAAFVLDARERDALKFFEAIVRENADLLVVPDALTAGGDEARTSSLVDPRPYSYQR